MERLRALVEKLRSQRGQFLMVFALIVIPLSFALGVVAVDGAMWQSEKRGAQKDADLVVLAGVLELAKPVPDGAAAEAAALQYADINDEAGNAEVVNLTVDGSCFNTGRLDAVTADISHESRTFFGSAFGLNIAPDIGAHAKACAGAPRSPGLGGALPFQIDVLTSPCFDTTSTPIYTQMCGLEYGAQGGGGPGDGSASRGLINLRARDNYCSEHDPNANPSIIDSISGDLESGLCWSNDTNSCSPVNSGPWHDCVAIIPTNAQNVLLGTRNRIAKEENPALSACDPDGNGIHDFEDVIDVVFDTGDPTTSVYEARDCDPNTEGVQPSPRLGNIVILAEPPGSNPRTGYPILAFATFYIVGCASEAIDDITEDDPRLNKKCPSPGSGPPGRVVVYGKFIRMFVRGGEASAPGPADTDWTISLVE